jgi:hypothetical protein
MGVVEPGGWLSFLAIPSPVGLSRRHDSVGPPSTFDCCLHRCASATRIGHPAVPPRRVSGEMIIHAAKPETYRLIQSRGRLQLKQGTCKNHRVPVPKARVGFQPTPKPCVVRRDFARILGIRGLCLPESLQTDVRRSAARHVPIPDYVPTIPPLFAYYPSTIWRWGTESNTSLCDSRPLPHRGKSLTDTRILEFPKHFPQIVPNQAHSPESFHCSVTLHPLLFHY